MFSQDCPPAQVGPTVAHETLVVNPDHIRILCNISRNIIEAPDASLSNDESVLRRSWHQGYQHYIGELIVGDSLSLIRMDFGSWTKEKLKFNKIFDDTLCEVATWEASRATRATIGALIRVPAWNEGVYVTWGNPHDPKREKAADLDAIVSNTTAPNEIKTYALKVGQSVTDRRVRDLLPEFEDTLIEWCQRPHRNGGLLGKLSCKLLSV